MNLIENLFYCYKCENLTLVDADELGCVACMVVLKPEGFIETLPSQPGGK